MPVSFHVRSSQVAHSSTPLQTEKLRPVAGQRSAPRTRGQVRRSPRVPVPTRSGLDSSAPRRAVAEPELSAGALVSVCLSGCLPAGTAGLRRGLGDSGGVQGQGRGRRAPAEALKAPRLQVLKPPGWPGRGMRSGIRIPDAPSGGRGGGGELLVASGAGAETGGGR